jgi:hypothetical protein
MRNFTTEDFSGSGQYLVRCDKEPGKYVDAGFLSTVMKKVGYCHGKGLANEPEKGNVSTLVDMSDGMTALGYFDTTADKEYGNGPVNTHMWKWVQFDNTQVLCDYLNNPDLCKQEYRFATQEEVVRVVMYQKSRWR